MIEAKNEIQNHEDANTSHAGWHISMDLFYLVSCAVHGTAPDSKRIKRMNLTGLFRVARFHLLSAITYMALESAGVFATDSPYLSEDNAKQLAKDWKEKKDKAIRKNLLLDTERRELFSIMEQKGIWYMPLKGIILKDLYPKTGMRQMADNDILFDSKYQWKLKALMESRGFKTISVGKGNHDVYEKKPIYNYEMHTSLYGKGHDEDWVTYYSDVKERLIQDTDSQYGYHFSDEDFYVYIITHAYKHYNGSGTGIRSLLDIYVDLMRKETSLNWDYVHGELNKLHVSEFEADSRELAKKLFSQELCTLTANEEKLLRFYLGSGTYGTLKNRIEKKMHEYQPDGKEIQAETKKIYLMKRLLPDEEYYHNYAPFAYQHKWFRPVFVVYRTARGILRNGSKICREVRMVIKIKK